MATLVYTRTGALVVAGDMATALEDAVVHLGKEDINITSETTKAELEAHEADFSGYAALTVATWALPYTATAGGASISSGYYQWNWTAATPPDPDVGNTIFYFWLEDADGNVIVAGKFESAAQLEMAGNSLPFSLNLTFGRT